MVSASEAFDNPKESIRYGSRTQWSFSGALQPSDFHQDLQSSRSSGLGRRFCGRRGTGVGPCEGQITPHADSPLQARLLTHVDGRHLSFGRTEVVERAFCTYKCGTPVCQVETLSLYNVGLGVGHSGLT